MSTRDIAYSVFLQLNETELLRFIEEFSKPTEDLFYSEANMQHLNQVIDGIEDGTRPLVAHELIEVDDAAVG